MSSLYDAENQFPTEIEAVVDALGNDLARDLLIHLVDVGGEALYDDLVTESNVEQDVFHSALSDLQTAGLAKQVFDGGSQSPATRVEVTLFAERVLDCLFDILIPPTQLSLTEFYETFTYESENAYLSHPAFVAGYLVYCYVLDKQPSSLVGTRISFDRWEDLSASENHIENRGFAGLEGFISAHPNAVSDAISHLEQYDSSSDVESAEEYVEDLRTEALKIARGWQSPD